MTNTPTAASYAAPTSEAFLCFAVYLSLLVLLHNFLFMLHNFLFT